MAHIKNILNQVGGFVNGSALRRTMAAAVLVVSVFMAGYSLGDKDPPPLTFHDMVVNHPEELSSLVTPDDPQVKALARELKNPRNAYIFIRDSIAFDPALPSVPAGEILGEKRASCLGKAALLTSLYLAMDLDPDSVRVVTGEVEAGQGIIDHAWVELEYEGRCLQQDATDLLGRFTFDQFQGMSYTAAFIRREMYAFNNRGFTVVSRLNMLRGSGHPVLIKAPL